MPHLHGAAQHGGILLPQPCTFLLWKYAAAFVQHVHHRECSSAICFFGVMKEMRSSKRTSKNPVNHLNTKLGGEVECMRSSAVCATSILKVRIRCGATPLQCHGNLMGSKNSRVLFTDPRRSAITVDQYDAKDRAISSGQVINVPPRRHKKIKWRRVCSSRTKRVISTTPPRNSLCKDSSTKSPLQPKCSLSTNSTGAK